MTAAMMSVLAPRLRDALAKARPGGGRRSPLSDWMLTNCADVNGALDKGYSWRTIAAGIGALGVINRQGNAPSVASVQRAYYAARRRAAGRQPERPRKVDPVPLGREAMTRPPPPDEPDDNPVRKVLQESRAPRAPAPPPTEDFEEMMRRLGDEARGKAGRMPRVQERKGEDGKD